ncbi:MAG: DNA gyrase/topoisomerase IV subunit A, partial [Algoriphagus sp.]
DAPNVLLIEKFNPDKVLSAIYFDGGSKTYYIKRFQIETTTLNKNFNFISDHKNSYLKLVSTEKQPQARVTLIKGKEEEVMEYDLDMLIDIKGWKALGNKLSTYEVKDLSLIQSKKTEANKEAASDEEQQDSEAENELEIGSTIDLSVKKDDEEQLGLF